ncbi:TonB-dependent receptor [Hyphomonas sp. UBA4494]|jgi:TonB-dependent receptor|uniref:TonB-dependent receptor n=1 Tax=Hyphomonas sp. UBA4494 TaxID=1946631 RepID=UPI0025C23F35|nr:TonB-dependent receptor [Hyphomonas sp. UBA4494]
MTVSTDKVRADSARKVKWGTLLCSASAVSLLSALPLAAQAQDANEETLTQETVVVQGIRGSLERAMDIKRSSNGVVDAISAEDIGKFPDTNLAESLQRITGVSINRVNGEGSEITVRGFGPGFNLVTLNGRTMPTAKIRAIGARGNYGAGGDRAFDFANLASEGVNGLEVYKTGQSVLPSGGLGATVNIKTRTPFDDPGLNATFSAKAINDTSVEAGDDFTPELSGLVSWTDPSDRFGIGIFGSYSKRDSGAPSQQINDWIVRESTDGTIDGSYVRGDGSTQITNPPAAGQLYAIAQDSRYDFSDISRERLNGQLVLQFRPIDNLTLTGDYTYAQNEADELRYEQTNWFATPLDQIIFDNDGPVATAVFMQENNNGSKDIGFEQTNRATKDEMNSIGFNADWEFSERGTIIFDAHSSKSESGGNNPLGHVATFVSMGAPVILQHSVDYRSGSPIQSYTIDDSVRGNGNGVLDAGDLGTQVQRSNSANMEHQVDEFDLRFVWDFDDRTSLTVGSNYRDTQMDRTTRTTQQDLGSWGISNPGDVEQFAPGAMQQYCLSCLFDDVAVGQADVAFRTDAAQLFPILEAAYAGNAVNVSESDDTVQEEILSFYAQFNIERDFMGLPTRTNIGVRYEDTNVNSTTVQSIPSGILWQSDNDFLIVQSGAQQDLSGKGAYEEVLPNVDFQVDLTENVVARASFSKTIGRAAYSNLFSSTTTDAPNRPTAFGGSLTGESQNPGLLPLKSTNFDASVEWYYDDSSYVSLGYFDKKVKNFIGNGVVERNLFGLRDPASGVSGSRSGDALAIINTLGVDQSEANLFTLTALIDANGGDTAAARAEFESQLVGGVLPQSYVDQILGQYDVASNASDPLALFGVEQPINNREGNIDGLEFAWQHFFGETGFGFQANYTLVNGDVELNPAGDINENQFALLGLSDTANVTAIYEKYGFSARLAYNWRDTFLLNTNEGGDRSGIYTEEYSQIDLNVSYDINDQIAVSFEGINLAGEDQRLYHRVPEQVYYVYELAPRYQVGVRYKF